MATLRNSAAALVTGQMWRAAPRGARTLNTGRVAAAFPQLSFRQLHLVSSRHASSEPTTADWSQQKKRACRWQGHQQDAGAGAGAQEQGGARAYCRPVIDGLAMLSAAGAFGLLHGGMPPARSDGLQVTRASDGPRNEPDAVSQEVDLGEVLLKKLQALLSDLQTLLAKAIQQIKVLVAKAFDGFNDQLAKAQPLMDDLLAQAQSMMAEAMVTAKGLLSQLQPLLAYCMAKLQAIVSESADNAAPAKATTDAHAAPALAGAQEVVAPPAPTSTKTADLLSGTTSTAAEQSFYQKYGWMIIAGSIIGAGLGVLLSRRALEAESAKIIALRTEEAVRSTMPAHPRRASVGGPLQNSHEHAALVRDALDILSASPAIAAALGTPPFKEGRLQALQATKAKGAAAGGNISGKMSLKGEKGTCSVSIVARRSDIGMECEALVVTLPSGESIEVPIVSSRQGSA